MEEGQGEARRWLGVREGAWGGVSASGTDAEVGAAGNRAELGDERRGWAGPWPGPIGWAGPVRRREREERESSAGLRPGTVRRVFLNREKNKRNRI